MKAYGRNKYDGWAWVDGGKAYSRSKSGRGHKFGASQKRTDRMMKKRGRRWKSEE